MFLNGILFLLCVVLFNIACIFLLFGAFPLFFVFMFLFSMCYWAMRWEPKGPKQIHLTYFNGDNAVEPSNILSEPEIDEDFYDKWGRN